MTGEMGYPSALTAKTWGYYDVMFKGNEFSFMQPYGSYVMENILFKISYPAEFHAQTAVEAAMILHAEVKDKIDDIERIEIETQEPGVRIIDKTGPLDNPADRDHCLQYMIAVPMILGRLTAADYEDDIANDPRIDILREKMQVRENENYTKDYFAADKRYIGNAIQVFFRDGSSTEKVAVDYPIGHRQRREEGIPVLIQKFKGSVSGKLRNAQWEKLDAVCADRATLSSMPVDDFMALLVV
jgi:2-methylcitrate dehydratase